MLPSVSLDALPSRVIDSTPLSSASVTVWSGPALAVGGWLAGGASGAWTVMVTVSVLVAPSSSVTVRVTV